MLKAHPYPFVRSAQGTSIFCQTSFVRLNLALQLFSHNDLRRAPDEKRIRRAAVQSATVIPFIHNIYIYILYRRVCACAVTKISISVSCMFGLVQGIVEHQGEITAAWLQRLVFGTVNFVIDERDNSEQSLSEQTGWAQHHLSPLYHGCSGRPGCEHDQLHSVANLAIVLGLRTPYDETTNVSRYPCRFVRTPCFLSFSSKILRLGMELLKPTKRRCGSQSPGRCRKAPQNGGVPLVRVHQTQSLAQSTLQQQLWFPCTWWLSHHVKHCGSVCIFCNRMNPWKQEISQLPCPCSAGI